MEQVIGEREPQRHAPAVYGRAANDKPGFSLCSRARPPLKSFRLLYQRHKLWMAYLQVYPPFDSLRDDPRIDELVKRVGLMP